MAYVSCLSVDSVQKRHVYISISNILPYKQLCISDTVASLEAGWYLKARLMRACIPYLMSLFQLNPSAKPINMKHSFPSRYNTHSDRACTLGMGISILNGYVKNSFTELMKIRKLTNSTLGVLTASWQLSEHIRGL